MSASYALGTSRLVLYEFMSTTLCTNSTRLTMNQRHILSSVLIFVILHIMLSFANGCLDSERRALLDFKSLITDPSGQLISWQGQNCCSWNGIRCSSSRTVIALNLRNPNPASLSLFINLDSELISTSFNSTKSTALKGTISPSLFTLNNLRHLDLSFNDFMSSKLPHGLSNLTRLTYLNLSNAMFDDSITMQLANLSSLTKLDISCSYMVPDFSTTSFNLTAAPKVSSGSMSSYIDNGKLSSYNLTWLRGLTNLKELRLDGVDLSQASQSTSWAEPISFLSNLSKLHLSNCGIYGRIPVDNFLNLTNLHSLIMDSNSLSSQIPVKLANLTNLSVIDFSSCNLQGSIPYLPRLKRLYLGNNYGIINDLNTMFSVPWPNLERLDIDYTQVTSEIPDSLANSTMLAYFSAKNCSIQGSIPSSLMNLSSLQVLILDSNNIAGDFPPSISNLKGLELLSLAENRLTGSISVSVCEISTLQYLNLDNNLLTGELPGCISQLPNLFLLYVARNNLIGTIPFSLFQNSNLVDISIGSNELTVKIDGMLFVPNFQPQILQLMSCNVGGRVPDFISNLSELQYLQLANNNLSGPIPQWLFNLPSLSYLDLSTNNLQGFLPQNIKLRLSAWPATLNVAGNKLQGPIPTRLVNVEVINLADNGFTGSIPSQIGESLDIKYISFAGNRLYGQIPRSFCREGNVLAALDLSNNSLSGSIPIGFGNCTSLVFLNLGGNKLEGNISFEPQGAKTKSLMFLDLNTNNFNGTFPSVIRLFQSLKVLNLANNKFEGKIPEFIGDLHDLSILVLASNFFTESIPQEIMQLQKLQYIDFSNNILSGPIPEILSGLNMLTFRPTDGAIIGSVISVMFAGIPLIIMAKGSSQQRDFVYSSTSGIDISNNTLTGIIPEEIGLLQGLYMLNLSHNHLTGEIPNTIGDMKGLESLDLSFNALSGEIPVTMISMDFLAVLNLSYNYLSGRIPVSPHSDTLYNDYALYGNPLLCGDAPGVKECSDSETFIPPTSSEDGDDDKDKYVFYGIVGMGYGVGFWGCYVVLYMMKGTWKVSYWRFVDRIVLKIIAWFRRERVRVYISF